ncbi:MAG: hypothetical protein Ct9H90mP19_5290 [Gammaproteobacteria bacterium]|nr:MAG: hypothetical protein Ct9H90mP19_5290 [Gammaproteobacteria bacterium]
MGSRFRLIIAGIPIGYAEDILILLNQGSSINGKKFKTAGKINMDLITINLEQDSSIKIGIGLNCGGLIQI